MAERQHPTQLLGLLSYYDRVHTLLSKLMGGSKAADGVQETYLRILNFAPNGLHNPGAYINTVARNVASDWNAAERRDWRLRAPPETFENLPDDAPSPEAVLDYKIRVARIAEALNELPAACRAAFVMNKLQGLGHREIAERLGISRSMVEKHIMRALAHCRHRLHTATGQE